MMLFADIRSMEHISDIEDKIGIEFIIDSKHTKDFIDSFQKNKKISIMIVMEQFDIDKQCQEQ